MKTANNALKPSSTLLWGLTGTMIALIIFASTQDSRPLTFAVLGLLIVYALFGVCFGVWAARQATKRSAR